MNLQEKLKTAKKLASSPFESDRTIALKLVVELLEIIILGEKGDDK